MSLMQLLHVVPTNGRGGHVPAPVRPAQGQGRLPRDAGVAPGFDQTLQQSQRRLDRADRARTAGSSATDEAVSQADTRKDGRATEQGGSRGAAREQRSAEATHDTAEQGTSKSSAEQHEHESREATDETAGREAGERHADDAGEKTSAEVSGEVHAQGGDDDNAAEDVDLRTLIKQMLEQSQAADVEDGALSEALPAEAIDQIVAMLNMALQGGDATALQSAGEQAGDALADMMRQLAATLSKGQPGQLAAMAGMMQKGMSQHHAAGQGMGIEMANMMQGDAAALASMFAAGDEGASSEAGQRFGQAMAALATAMQGAAPDGQPAAGGGTSLDAMLAQLVNLSTTTQGQGHAAADVMAAQTLFGGLTAQQSPGQTVGQAMNAAGFDAAAMNEADNQTNMARLGRALNSAVNQGGGTLTLRMTPPEMGTVRIQLQVQAGTVNAALHVENGAARSLLGQQLSQLREALESQGLQVERLNVQSMNSSSSSSMQHNADGSPNDGRSRDEYTQSGHRHGRQQQDDTSGQPHSETFEQAMGDIDDDRGGASDVFHNATTRSARESAGGNGA